MNVEQYNKNIVNLKKQIDDVKKKIFKKSMLKKTKNISNYMEILIKEIYDIDEKIKNLEKMKKNEN